MEILFMPRMIPGMQAGVEPYTGDATLASKFDLGCGQKKRVKLLAGQAQHSRKQASGVFNPL